MSIKTPTSPEAWRPNQVADFTADDIVPTAVLLAASTVVGQIEGDEPALLLPYVADDPTAAFVPEGEVIGTDDPTLGQVRVTTGKLAVLTTVTNEAMAQPGAAQRILASLQRSLTGAADRAFLGSGGTDGPAGLFALPGVSSAGPLTDDLDSVYDAVATIEANGGEATVMIAHPQDWAHLAKLKAGTGSNVPLLGADATVAPTRSVAGVPVLTSAAAPKGTALIVDRSEVVSAVGPIRLDRSTDAAFNTDSVALRAAWRVGWAVVRPERLLKVTITGE